MRHTRVTTDSQHRPGLPDTKRSANHIGRGATARRILLLLLAGCLLCTACGGGVNMYKHKRNTDCGC